VRTCSPLLNEQHSRRSNSWLNRLTLMKLNNCLNMAYGEGGVSMKTRVSMYLNGGDKLQKSFGHDQAPQQQQNGMPILYTRCQTCTSVLGTLASLTVLRRDSSTPRISPQDLLIASWAPGIEGR